MDEAEQLCDRLVIMDKGRFLDEGNPKELISKHVGVEVIELRIERVELEKMVAKIDGEGVEHEYVADTLYIFLKDSSAASNILKKVDGFDFLHRRATLEDVYLKITGRELRE
jgi:lipooligosaccharide transport system ATP-binding protein